MHVVIWPVAWKDCFLVITTSRFSYVIMSPNLMMVQTSKGKVQHIYKELIRIIISLEHEKLPLLKVWKQKGPIVSVSNINYIAFYGCSEIIWIKNFTIFTMYATFFGKYTVASHFF